LKIAKLLIENDLNNIRADVFSSRDLKFWILIVFVFDLIVLLLAIITYELWIFPNKKFGQVCNMIIFAITILVLQLKPYCHAP
jgi:ABC-type cobalamin transport system permease subunit